MWLDLLGLVLNNAPTKFQDAQAAAVFLSELHGAGEHADAPKWFTDILREHMLGAHFNGRDVRIQGRAAMSLADALRHDVKSGYARARKRQGSTPPSRRAPTSHKPPQRTPGQRLEHAVQQALLLGNVPKQAKTVLAWKFRMDGEGPWTLREIVKDNDLNPDVLCGWLCEVVEGCPHVGDTCVTGGGAAATTTWERV